LGFYKVVKHNYFPGWHQQATTFELLINKDVWNKMSDQQRMAMEVITKASVMDCFAHTEAIQGEVIKANVNDRGVKIHYWSDEMLDVFRQAWEEVVEEQSADPFFKKVYDDFSAFHENYSYWASLGFMPRPAPPK